MRKNILILGHNDATQFIDIYNQYGRVFDRNKYAVTVAYLSGEESELTKQRTIADEAVFLHTSKKNLRGLKIQAVRKLLALVREKKFEIVICHRYKPAYVMMWVAQFCHIPKLFFVMHELGTMASLKRQLLIGCLARKNMTFAGVSNAVRDDMRNDLWCVPNARITTLYNVIDVEMTLPQLFSKETARAHFHLAEDAFVFGHLARLAPNKNQQNLIRAFSLIKKFCPKAKLIMIGDGSLAATLKDQVKALNLENDIIFTGFLAGGFRYMRAFDCFVLPSLQEAFGRVLLEAMIAKLPIIASNVHGIPEVVADTGFLVDPKDTSALAAAMQQVYFLSKEELEHLGEKGHQQAAAHFSIPAFQQQFWQHLQKI